MLSRMLDTPDIPDSVKAVWTPQPGSQELFLACPVFEVLYEGTRGPGKTDALLYDTAKDGSLPNVDVNGDPINWGVGDVIGAADALAAFADMQFWLNSSDMQPPDFAAAIMGQAGLSYVPDEL